MKISELARATRTPVGTIRHYEREGLLPEPPRQQDNGYRRYGPADVERLGLIRQARALDMSLDEIRVLLALHDTPQAPCDAVNALLDAHIGHVRPMRLFRVADWPTQRFGRYVCTKLFNQCTQIMCRTNV